ncbi:MAG: amidohydrolase family protein [Planctomycetota bacterium]
MEPVTIRHFWRSQQTLGLIWVVFLFFVLESHQTFGQNSVARMVLKNGNIFTVDESRPRAESIAISGDRIIAVGSNQAIEKYIGAETRIIDLDGKFVMPGFIEGHAHFVGLGELQMMLQLQAARSWQEIVKQVEAATKVTPPGEWIIGRGWHQSKWDSAPVDNVDGYPTRAAMDKISPNHPVLLEHASGHMSFANGYALKLAGVDNSTQNPKGGEILKDENGAPIGVFRETASALIERIHSQAVAQKSIEERAEYLARAVELASLECQKKGVTSFQDAGSSLSMVEKLKAFAEKGKLGVRLYVMIRDQNRLMEGKLARYKTIGHANHFFTCRSLKRSIDGALGPHGAWLLAPYTDLPSSAGLNTASVESVRKTAELGIQNGFQVCVHAIGDRANREVLDIYEDLFQANRSSIPRRWRIEHAQHLDPADIPRFSDLGVIASMQGIHCTSDAIFVPKRLGMRRSQEGAYVWQSLMKSGAVVTNGTDAPVEDVNPIASFYSSITRKMKDGRAFFPEQVMSREQAIRSYTIDCAYSAFEETLKGSLVRGKLADLVVLSNDLITCPIDEVPKTKVLMTMIGGKLVYQSNLE